MQLGEWIENRGTTAVWVSKKVSDVLEGWGRKRITDSAIRRASSGKLVSLPVACAIQVVTDGDVTCMDILRGALGLKMVVLDNVDLSEEEECEFLKDWDDWINK